MSTATSAITVNDVSHAYASASGDQAVTVLSDIKLEVSVGELVAIVGPSGCGKTTLINMMAGLESPLRGDLLVNGKRPTAGDPDVGYVLARDSLLPWRTALRNAELGLELTGVPARERRERARDALHVMGLGDFTHAYGAQLSHGMRQRVALARSFAMSPGVLLMDEPFSALDAQTRLRVQDAFLSSWEKQTMTVVLITHDLSEAVGLADRVVIMTRRPGQIKAIHTVNLPRPRSMLDVQGDPRFHEQFEAIWADLRDEFVTEEAADAKGMALL